MQNFFDFFFQKKHSRHKFHENWPQRSDSKVMIHNLWNTLHYIIQTLRALDQAEISRLVCPKTDDVMSDDVIIDYIITKNGEMTLLVYVSPFKGWSLGRVWWFKMMLRCLLHRVKGLIPKKSTLETITGDLRPKFVKNEWIFRQLSAVNFLKGWIYGIQPRSPM